MFMMNKFSQKVHFFTVFTVLILIFVIVIPVSAQQEKDSTNSYLYDLSLDDLLDIKINSASRISENIFNLPQTAIIITEEEIRNRGYIDLEQLFHDIPGFDISRGNGTHYAVLYQRGYRSNNTDRTLLLIDGVEENDLWSNNIWLSKQYPISNIKRVEIIYGPSSTIYGPNAFIGIINIVTKDADEIIQKKKFGITGQVNYGSWNTAFADLTMAVGNKDYSFTLTGRYYRSDEMDLSSFDDWDYDLSGYDLNYYKDILGTNNDAVAQTALDMDNKAYYGDTALHDIPPHYSNDKRDYYLYGKLKLKDFSLGFSTFKRDEGFGTWYRDDFELGPENGGRWVPRNSFFYLKYEKEFSDKISITSFTRFKEHQLTGSSEELYYIGYFNKSLGLDNLIDENGLLLPDSLLIKPYWYLTWYHTYSIQMRTEFYTRFKPNEKMDIITGIELRKSFIQGEYLVSEVPNPEENAIPPDVEGGNNFQSRDFGIYTQINYKFSDNLDLYVGGRLDNNKIRTTGGYGTVFMPKVALIYRPDNYSFKFIYSEAYKDAGFWTKYGTTPGRLLNNPGLMPEKVRNFETSFLWNLSSNIFIDLSAYHANYTNTVGTANVSFVDENGDTIQTTQHQAIGSMQISGIQSNFIYKKDNYSAYFNYTYTYPFNTAGKDDIRIGDISTHKFNAGVDVFLFKKLNINLRLNYVGERPVGENTTIPENPLSKIDAYWLLNGAAAYVFSKNLSLQLSVNNLLNTLYYDPGVRSADGIYYAARMPQNERNFMLKLNFNF